MKYGNAFYINACLLNLICFKNKNIVLWCDIYYKFKEYIINIY